VALLVRSGVVPLVVPHARWADPRPELDLGVGVIAVSPLFIAFFVTAVFLVAGGWTLIRPPRGRD